jgi:DNA-binding XRE family transcriptional regulator
MYRSQLTDDEVRQIWLNEEGLSNTALAKKYGTTGHNVFQILTGRNWTHVTGGGDNRRNRRKMNRRSHGRLSDDMIRDIKRNPDKLTQAQLARRHSVSPTTVCHILKGFLFPDIQ